MSAIIIKELNDLALMSSNPVTALTQLLDCAIKLSASDIHIESHQKKCWIRMCIQGELKDMTLLPAFLKDSLITRIKFLSQMDIAKCHVAQDGRFTFSQVECRVASLPTIQGEKITVRLLNNHHNSLSLEKIGFSSEITDTIYRLLTKSQGMIICSGPTGSGKTTSQYAMIEQLAKQTLNIITVENPVEKIIPGVNQVCLNEMLGFNEYTVLKHILRQDPDVIMIGEVRDHATAELVVHAAATGHFILATTHSHDCVSTLQRFFNLGMSLDQLAENISLIISQRLILSEKDQKRFLLFEALLFNEQIRNILHDHQPLQNLRSYLKNKKWQSFSHCAQSMIKNGLINLKQAQRVLPYVDDCI